MDFPMAPRGLITDLITPLREDGTLDRPGLSRLLTRVCPHADALFLAGPFGGEGPHLSAALRGQILGQALEQAPAFLPILVWITKESASETRETLSTLKSLVRLPRDLRRVLWVDSPLYYHSNRGLPDHYAALVSLLQAPFILHNDPNLIERSERPLKRRNIRTAILKVLSAMDGVLGMIFLGSLERARNYERARQANPRFVIYDGDETHFLQFPSMGGVVSIGANLDPKAWETITRSSLQKSAQQNVYPDHVRQIWELGTHLNSLLEAYSPAPVPIIKQVLARKGIIESPFCFSRSGGRADAVQRILGLLA